MKIKDVCILDNIPNRNHRVYSDEVLKQIAVDAEGKTYVGGTGGFMDRIADTPWLANVERVVSHEASNIRVEHGKLLVDIQVLDSEQGKHLKEIIKNTHMSFVAGGYGSFEEEASDIQGERVHTVKDFVFTQVACIPTANSAVRTHQLHRVLGDTYPTIEKAVKGYLSKVSDKSSADDLGGV